MTTGVESIPTHSRDASRDRNLCQIAAGIKGIVADARHAVGNDNAGNCISVIALPRTVRHCAGALDDEAAVAVQRPSQVAAAGAGIGNPENNVAFSGSQRLIVI